MDEDIRALAKAYNLKVEVTMPCPHCYYKRLYDGYQFSLKECETAQESGLSIVHCQRLVPVRLDKVAPDIALAAIADKKIDYKQIQLTGFIDEGGFAVVYAGKYNGVDVAVKLLKTSLIGDGKEDPRSSVPSGSPTSSVRDSSTTTETPTDDYGNSIREELRKEIWVMSGLSHPNIVAMLGYCTTPPCIVSEFVPEGNLLALILDQTKALTIGMVLRIATDIAKALSFLHTELSPPMIHNDLKSLNVLLQSKDETAPIIAKLTDFGMSRRAAWGKSLDADGVNPRWIAPEVLLGQAFTPKADIYAFGIIIWELVSRKMFMGDEKFMFTVRDKIVAGERPPIPLDCPVKLQSLIDRCWSQKPDDRPDISDCRSVLEGLLGKKNRSLLDISNASNSNTKMAVRPMSVVRAPTIGEPENQVAKLTPTGQFPVAGSVRCVTYCPRWKQVWCGDGVGHITIFTEKEDNCWQSELVSCHDKEVLALLRTGESVWSLSTDETVKIWNQKIDLLKSLPAGRTTAMAKVLGKVWLASETDTMTIVDKRTFKTERKFKMHLGDFGGGIVTCMLLKLPYVWVGTSFNILRLDAATGKVVDVLRGHSRIVHRLLSVGKEVWSCSSDRSIRVWDKAGRCLDVLNAHGGRVFDMVLESGVNPVVWSCAWDTTIMVWDAQTRELIFECAQSHRDAVSCLVQVGGYIWSGSWDRKLSLWENVGLRRLLALIRAGEIEPLLQNSEIFYMVNDSVRLSLGKTFNSFASRNRLAAATSAIPPALILLPGKQSGKLNFKPKLSQAPEVSRSANKSIFFVNPSTTTIVASASERNSAASPAGVAPIDTSSNSAAATPSSRPSILWQKV